MSDSPQFTGPNVGNDTSPYAWNNPQDTDFTAVDAINGDRVIQVTPVEIITDAIYSTDEPEKMHLWGFFIHEHLPDPQKSLRSNLLLVVPPYMKATRAWLQVRYSAYPVKPNVGKGISNFSRVLFFENSGGAWVFSGDGLNPLSSEEP